tara:strand:+ start:365 stop:646 length:282 start_codon:yes stop_codon:yes gene_type:complete
MVRSELVTKLANQYPNILRKDIEKIINVIFSEITDALSRGENVEIRGWGTLKVKIRKARMGRNPKSSETIQIPAKKAVKWKMSKTLFNRLNKL